MHARLSVGVAALSLLVAAGVGCATSISTGGTSSGGGGGAGGGVGGAGGGGGGSVTASSSTGPMGPCTMAVDCTGMNDACNVGTCVNGECQRKAANDFASCDDGLYCTENDVCMAGKCTGGSTKYCAPDDSCHIGTCDEAAHTCKSVAGNDGAQCDDKDPCTQSGVCSNGMCAKGQPVDCTVFDGECTTGTCDPVTGCKPVPSNEGGMCTDGKASPCSTGVCTAGLCGSVPTNEGGPCDDKLFCTISDTCKSGACSGVPNPCAPPGGCYIASCDENLDMCTAVPGNDGSPCDDFNSCTKNTTCLAGACINGAPDNEGAMCDDSSACTSGTTCTAGVCGGGVGPTVYFADDFHDNSKGWLLGPEWQIGPAMVSTGGVYGADPADDHSASADNGIAGVVIGGNENPVVHPYYYIESPPFNTSAAAGPVILGFYRWINSDYDPYMHNQVEVYDGSSWNVLWQTGPSPGIQDSPPVGTGWTYMQFDVTAYKSAAMKVRFGYDIGSSGVFTIGSWNLDDVLVASAACP